MVIVRCLRDGDKFYNMWDWVSIRKKDTSEWISGQLGYIGTKKFDVITTEWHKDHPNDLVHRHSREIHSCDVEYVIKINQLFNTNYNAACTKLALENKESVCMNLTRDEQFILENLLIDFKYVARDLLDNNICGFHEKPKKTLDKWECETKTNKLKLPFKHLFKDIKWEDEEPVIISELLKQQRLSKQQRCKRNL